MVEYTKTNCAKLVTKVNNKFATKLLTTLLVLLIVTVIVTPIINVGCQEEKGQPTSLSSPNPLSSSLVPNMDLDVYIYIKQDEPTTLPADMIDAPFDVVVESLAIWGIHSEDDFAFSGGLSLLSASDASNLYTQITPDKDMWTKLSGNTIYFVEGSGIAAESLKRAISKNDFKYYDDQKSLKVVAALPDGGATKLAAVAIVKPSKALIGRITGAADTEALGLINLGLKIVGLNVVVAGLYCPHQIDVAEIAKVIEHEGSIGESDLGVLILAKSGLPGFIVEPIVKKFLTEAEYAETNLGELTIYKGFLDTDDNKAIPVLVRLEGNYIFIAISGQESYAQTLITGVNK